MGATRRPSTDELNLDWRHPLVWWALGAQLAAVVVVIALLFAVHPEPVTERVMWLVAPFVLLPVLAVVAVNVRHPDRGNAGKVIVRTGIHLVVLTFGAALVEGMLIPLVTVLVVEGAGRGGLDYVMGGAALSMAAAALFAMALLVVGAGTGWVIDFRDRLPWPLRWLSLPLALVGATFMIAGCAMGADASRRRLAGLVEALTATGDKVKNAEWLLVGRVGAVAFVAGLALTVVAGRLPKAQGGSTGDGIATPQL